MNTLFSRKRPFKRKTSNVDYDIPTYSNNLSTESISATSSRPSCSNVTTDLQDQEDSKKKEANTQLLSDATGTQISVPTQKKVGKISKILEVAGNKFVWTSLIALINKQNFDPQLIYGPTGCGKTKGVQECARICGLRVFEIDPSFVAATEDLKKWLENIGNTKTLLGPRLILIDVIEGFDISFLKCIQDYLKKRKKTDTPIIIICTDPYNIEIRSFCDKSFPKEFRLRCYKPNDTAATAWAQLTVAKHMSKESLKPQVTKANGDLRNLKYRLTTNLKCDQDITVSLFETTNRLLSKTTSIENWLRCASSYSLDKIMFDNYLSFRAKNKYESYETIAKASDLFSECEVLDPETSLYLKGLLMSTHFEHQKDTTKLQLCNVQKHQTYCSFSEADMPELLRIV